MDIDLGSLVVEGWGDYFLIASYFTKKTEEKSSERGRRVLELWKEKEDIKEFPEKMSCN